MRAKSHIQLGILLADRYMSHVPERYRRAFLFGCIQPDRNPATYLKGSLRGQWLRGHNFENALPFMLRIARRLEKKKRLSLWDYYTAGKLIHYTMDSFTYAHNVSFPEDLALHRAYEMGLQDFFLNYLTDSVSQAESPIRSIPGILCSFHQDYLHQPGSIPRDSHYAYSASCSIMSLLAAKL